MALDVNEFVSQALQEGHSIDDVVNFMSTHKNEGYKNWATNWQNTASAPEYKAGSADQRIQFEAEKERMRQEFDKQKKELTTTNVLGVDVPSILTGPATGIAGAAAGVAAGLYGAKKIKERSIKNPQVAEVVGDVAKERVNPYSSPESMFEATPEQIRIAKQQSAAQAIQQQVVGPKIPPQFSGVGVPAGDIPPAPPYQPIEFLKSKVEAGRQAGLGLKDAIEPTTKTRAPKTQKTFKSAADIPEGFVFRPDVGNLDRSMGNILGKEHREYARELFNGGKPFGHSADLNADVSKLTTEYFKRLQQEVPETILSREARIAQKVPSEFGTFAKGTNFGKAAKVAGVAGTLLAIADLANAKTPEQKATAGTNLLGAVLPPFMDVNDVGAPTVSDKQFENAYKLGSPYAQTEEAKKARLKEKAGAGRGIAPPSAYMR